MLSVATPGLRSFLEGLLCQRLRTIVEYFIEYDLDTKGISSLAFFLEEEFKDKFES